MVCNGLYKVCTFFQAVSTSLGVKGFKVGASGFGFRSAVWDGINDMWVLGSSLVRLSYSRSQTVGT